MSFSGQVREVQLRQLKSPVDEEGSQSLTRVILRPISQILVNVTLKLVNACGHNSTSGKYIPIVYYPLSERVLNFLYQAWSVICVFCKGAFLFCHPHLTFSIIKKSAGQILSDPFIILKTINRLSPFLFPKLLFLIFLVDLDSLNALIQ